MGTGTGFTLTLWMPFLFGAMFSNSFDDALASNDKMMQKQGYEPMTSGSVLAGAVVHAEHMKIRQLF